MKTRTKALVLAFSAVLLVVTTVFVTMAFLTGKDQVTNTFTVGKVAISLDERDVDVYGSPVPSASPERVQENTYKLIPGHTYTKDPIVHVAEGSENSWVFVKVENQIADIIVNDTNNQSVESQITANGWTALDGVAGVYYKEYTGNGTEEDYVVFENFKVKDDAVITESYEGKTIVITAYAIQRDGFNDVNVAWNTVSDVYATPTAVD